MEKAILAAGCFWGVQYYFDQVPGVVNSEVGYTGGHVKNPTYEQVCYENSGHAEAVLIEYDTQLVAYETLLRHFFRLHDPTQLNRQGPDIGEQYRSAIFYMNETQKQLAEKLKADIQLNFDKPITTEIVAASDFYKAEDYHQRYVEKTGRGMCHVAYQPI